MQKRAKRPAKENRRDEGSSPSDGQLTLVEMAILHLGEKLSKIDERVARLEREQ